MNIQCVISQTPETGVCLGSRDTQHTAEMMRPLLV